MNEQVNGKGDDKVNLDTLIDERKTAKALCCTVSTLRKWRLLERGPAYCKVGRLVRYAEGDLQEFLAANRVQPTGGAQ
jgi:hypothetical protein